MRPTTNTHADLKGLRILCIALMTGVVIFAGVILGLNYFDPMTIGSLAEYADLAFYISAGVAGISFLIARQLFGKKMQAIKNASVNVSGKLNQYRTAFISYMALCEGPALFAIILFMLSGNYLLLLVVLAMLLAMARKFPTRQRLIDDMTLDWQEQQELE